VIAGRLGEVTTPGRLIGRSARPFALAVLVIAATVTAVLGGWLAGRHTVTAFDVHSRVRIDARFAGHGRTAVVLAALGSTWPVVLATAILVVSMLVRRRLRAVVLAALAPPVAIAITDWVLKPLIDRSMFGGYLYPSGHTTAAFAVATVVVVLLLDESNAGPRLVRWAGAVAALTVAGLVAVGLVAAGYHFFTDTIGGAGVGISVAVLIALTIDAIADRRSDLAAHPGLAPEGIGHGVAREV
jgi:undecaprenyl-diphosphatase